MAMASLGLRDFCFMMFCVALVPPLWRHLMDRCLDALAEARRQSAEVPSWLRAESCR